MKALFLSADHFEDTELLVPYYRLLEEKMTVEIASLKKGGITGKRGYSVEAGKTFDEVDPDRYDLLVLPGGKAPEAFRHNADAQRIAKAFFAQNKPVAAICHGPQTLVFAGLLKGRHATCYRSVVPELKEAGALYEEKEVVVDGNLVTSRQPSDLPAFLREMMKMVKSLND